MTTFGLFKSEDEILSAKPADPWLAAGDDRGPWMQTASGRKLHLLNPQPGEIVIEDIAHGLSHIARFNGQTKHHWPLSVAQHSLHVAAIAEKDAYVAGLNLRDAYLHGLLHDAHEAYIGDITTPVGRILNGGGALALLKARVQTAVYDALGIKLPSPEVSEIVRGADKAALLNERRRFLDGTEGPLLPQFAKGAFLRAFHETMVGYVGG